MIWIIGTGIIAQEYAKILKALGKEFIVIGRSGNNADVIKQSGAKEVISGGLEQYINTNPTKPNKAIVAVNVTELANVCTALLHYGVDSILLEKPGFCAPAELSGLVSLAQEKSAQVFLAYNRRCFASAITAENIINEDGGVISFNFEFTEWGHVIEKLSYSKDIFDNWFYANSTHVIDFAFFLGGEPKELHCHSCGTTSWHKPAIFAGFGTTTNGALFSYQANWNAPGRWGVEFLTSKHRLIFRPMEKLHIQNIGSVAITEVEIDDSIDKEFKPGFFKETELFIQGDTSRLCSIEEQMHHLTSIYNPIRGVQ